VKKISLFIMISLLITGCEGKKTNAPTMTEINKNEELDSIVLGGGCFWCVEAVFQRMVGVEKVVSGYTGGFIKNPGYKEICTGRTGHAEVVKVYFDKSKTSLEKIFSVFFAVHDPTTLNRQGADEGTQYRSAVFYATEEQKNAALKAVQIVNESGEYENKVVTEISPLPIFYNAEDYHQNYYNQNKTQSYCQFVVKTKVDKFEKLFKDIAK
jgi:methionine-S-sulfoxide reductase